MSYIRSIPSTLEETFHHFITSFTKLSVFILHNLVVIGSDYTGSCKSNYNMITATGAPYIIILWNKISTVWEQISTQCSYKLYVFYVHTLLYVFYSYPHCSWMMFKKGGQRGREPMRVGISVYQY